MISSVGSAELSMCPAIIIPTYNEVLNIELLLMKIVQLVPDAHIIVVDDESPDGTALLVKKTIPRFSTIHLISRTGKRGRGLSGIEGFKCAVEKGFNPIIEMDADGSHAPEKLPDFLTASKHYDVVIGSRYVKNASVKNRGILRNILSDLANGTLRIFLGISTQDCTSGFRCFRRSALESIHLDTMISTGPSIVFEILLACHKKNFNIVEIPIEFVNRGRGKSKLTLGKLLETFYMVFKIKMKK